MKTKSPVNKKVLDKKTPAIQRADNLDFIGEAIRESRSVVNDITREKHVSENMPIPQRKARKDSVSIYYNGIL